MERILSKLYTTGLLLLIQAATVHALWARPEREGEDGGGGSGASSCRAASGIGAVLGTLALGALATPVGTAAWLGWTAASLIFGIPATGISIGTAIGCTN
ncbi:hypothetical protein [Rhodothermus profundi]|uniref:Uncharacterized protein n=1 Tax=Rhodothermus profundi TaxID=633813 RepID=A0A1M6XAF9_9BACT|nr:hypothetical protein [Rhodothermus profundi]SHL02869.1 hypothetical protein SAMN04488087_2565 [Rhodothermus profundi]